jgi:3-isopropylmalate/(R)-2-methylmalate dehydratase large subunit
MRPTDPVALTPGKRILFLTKDPEFVRRQLEGELDLRMSDLRVEDLMDDINTDAMTPAWACFDYRPEDIARNAYAGITVDGRRLFPEGSLLGGNFEVIVSGARKGVGSSRETAPQAERWSGIRIVAAESFSPIYARNCLNLGLLLCNHAVLARLEAGERVPLSEFLRGWDATTRAVILHGGLFPFTRAVERGEVRVPAPAHPARPMTIAEKILARHVVGPGGAATVRPGDAVCVHVDGGYSHEFTTAQVHYFVSQEDGEAYRAANPAKFAVFEDHLIYADGVARMAPYAAKIQVLREMQRHFQKITGVRDYSAQDGVSPGICHTVARESFIEPGDFIQATDSHTTMGGSVGALAWGVGATEYAALIRSGLTFVEVPETVRFELVGALAPGVTAKDVMLHILAVHARRGDTLGRVLEFGGPGLASMSPDEHAVLANMATECAARTGIVEVGEATLTWIAARRPGARIEDLRAKVVRPDAGAAYAATFAIDLGALKPMVATPGDPARGVASDPTNGALIEEIGAVPIQIAYGGSCTAGKEDDLDQYAGVMSEAARAGRRVRDGVEFYIQFGSRSVEEYARNKGYLEVFEKTGVKLIQPGCGACIGCGPGVSASPDQVSVSAINRNYQNRSGPGKLYLASPLSVAASAVEGRIVAYREGMFTRDGA